MRGFSVNKIGQISSNPSQHDNAFPFMATSFYTTGSDRTTTIYQFSTICSVTSIVPTPMSPGTSTWQEVSHAQVTVITYLVDYVVDNCTNYANCNADLVQPNPDIAGLGIVLAFLITAWTAFVFLVIAYFGRLLPPDHIRRADKACFFVNSNKCEDKWKKTLDKVILTFSDQQLITGLTILIAGYYESSYHNLATHHWQIVVFLGWMSSTVHLVSLTLLRPWLNENLLIRNLRLFGMIVLLALLTVALYPSTDVNYLPSISSSCKVPVKCFWSQAWLAQIDTGLDFNNNTYGDAVITYMTLFSGYIWKIAQLLDGKKNRLRRYVFVPPMVKLERLARLNADPLPARWTMRWGLSKLIIYAYVLLMVITEVFESFMATLLFLLGTLSWGTIQILLTRSWVDPIVLDAEKVFSFGQLLPLLLLIQPFYAIIEHFAKSADEYQPVRPPPQPPHGVSPSHLPSPKPAVQKQSTMDVIANKTDPSCLSLSEVIRTCTLLTAEQKADQADPDPILKQLYQSRIFKFMIWWTYLISSSFGGTLLVLSFLNRGSLGRYPGPFYSAIMRLSIIKYGLPSAIVSIPIALLFSLIWSKRLS